MTQTFDVLLLSAGFGKRLAPLTDCVPKPLIEVAGKPLIAWQLEMLKRSGVERIFVNLHYLGQSIVDYVGDGARWGLEVSYSWEPAILETGGGIKKIAREMKTEHLLTVNCDLFLDPGFTLDALLDRYFSQEATDLLGCLQLAPVAANVVFPKLGVSDSGRIIELYEKRYSSENVSGYYVYTGLQILSKKLFEFFPLDRECFSITRDVYPVVLEHGGRLDSVIYTGFWSDVGTIARIADVESYCGALYSNRPVENRIGIYSDDS